MKICITLDGVLINKNLFQQRYGKDFFGNDLSFFNEYACEFKNMFNCNEEIEEKFWKNYRTKYYLSAKPEENSATCINTLREKGHEIYFIIDRKYLKEKNIKGDIYRFLLKLWFKNNNIKYDKIIYCEKDNIDEKVKICKENGINLFIDHLKYDTIVLSEYCDVLLYNRNYNCMFLFNNRIYNFYDILDKVNQKGNVKKYENV